MKLPTFRPLHMAAPSGMFGHTPLKELDGSRGGELMCRSDGIQLRVGEVAKRPRFWVGAQA